MSGQLTNAIDYELTLNPRSPRKIPFLEGCLLIVFELKLNENVTPFRRVATEITGYQTSHRVDKANA